MKKVQRDVSLTLRMIGSIDDEDRIASKEELGSVLSKLITGLSEDIKEATIKDVKDTVDGVADGFEVGDIVVQKGKNEKYVVVDFDGSIVSILASGGKYTKVTTGLIEKTGKKIDAEGFLKQIF